MAKAQVVPIIFLFVGTLLEQVVDILIKEVIAKSGNNYESALKRHLAAKSLLVITVIKAIRVVNFIIVCIIGLFRISQWVT